MAALSVVVEFVGGMTISSRAESDLADVDRDLWALLPALAAEGVRLAWAAIPDSDTP